MLSYLIQRSRWLMLAAALASLASGGCGVMLVALINAGLTADARARANLPILFAFAVLGVLVCQVGAALFFENLRQRASADLRQLISDRVMAAPYQRLERAGVPRIQSALSDHAANVARFFITLPILLTNGTIVLGCLIYLASLSWPMFVAAIGAIALGSAGYHLANLKALGYLDEASREQDRLFGHFRSLNEGGKELRLHRDKRERFAGAVLASSIDTVRRLRTRGLSIFDISTGWGTFLIYAFIGLVLFVLVGDRPDRTQVMTGFALVFVYMVSPLEGLLNALPDAKVARVASRRIDELCEEMISEESCVEPHESVELQTLELLGVTHRYYHEQSDEFFELGPIDLRFSPGEIVFLVGGNGSGKTTLAKLLTGLYVPEGGAVRLNGETIGNHNRDRYRQLFTAIFSDFHLFDQLLETGGDALDAEGNHLIEKLHLKHKVQMKDGAFTTQALSQGQRKRLALVVARLEDRPFLVFDEWAADQDPVFKKVFYHEVLPELRSQGKAVLVISHDDRFFSVADRVVRLESGRITAVEVSHLRGVRRGPQMCEFGEQA